MPSILMKLSNLSKDYLKVLNLVISGIPSILKKIVKYLFEDIIEF